MMRKSKKGFTIVELVIVIAVIAILAAVLIPTFSSVISNAQRSADTQLCKNINKALAMQVDGKNATMSDAMDYIAENGYTVDRLTPTTEGYMICWDQSSNRVVLLKENKTVYYSEEQNEGETPDVDKLWMIVHNETELKANKDDFSIYLADDYGAVDTIAVSKGFDCGKNNVANVVLTNADSTASYILNTVGSNVTISMPSATINHYGNAANVVVEKIAGQSYHAHGNISVLEVQSGRAVVESTGTVTNVIVSPVVDTMTDTEVTTKPVSVVVNGKVSYQTVSSKKVEEYIDKNAAEDKKESLKTAAQDKVDAVKTAVDAAMPEAETMAASVITTAADLKTALASEEAQFITLGADIELSDKEPGAEKELLKSSGATDKVGLKITKDVVLDLNGYKITYTENVDVRARAITVQGGNLTVNDSSPENLGAIIATNKGKYFVDDPASIWYLQEANAINVVSTSVNEISSVTINAGAIKGTYEGIRVYANCEDKTGSKTAFPATAIINGGSIGGSVGGDKIDCAFGVNLWGEGATVIVNNGKIEAVGNGIAGNGAAKNGGTDITFNGGEIISTNGVGIYHPQRGIMKINGGTITGESGIQMKAGHLYVTGGKITATYNAPTGALTDSGSATIKGAASAIVIGSNAAYEGGMIVDITGGEFISEHYYAIHELIPESATKSGTFVAATAYVNYIKITGGTYKSGTGYANIFIEYAFDKITTSGVSATIEYGSKAQ